MPGVTKELHKQLPLIRYSGYFDYGKLYDALTGWYNKNKFDFFETKHIFKVNKEFELELKGEKKVTPYFQYLVEISLKIWSMKKVEVVSEGKKQKMESGRVQVIIKGSYVLDYEGNWETTQFWERMREMYHKFIIKKKIELHIKDPLHNLVYELHTDVKRALGLEVD